ncbi:MAG TPA: S9 family peptidase, partial [Candidatus Limnocylindria bacterium]
MTEPAWKRRFRGPRFSFPQWARDRSERIVYGGNHEGTFEVYVLDLATSTERRLTSRAEGTGYRIPPRIAPQGDEVWWWDDAGGSERGVWRVQPFRADGAGGEARLATELGPAYSANLALGTGFAVVGRSGDEGTTIDLVAEGGARRLYAHRESAHVGFLSADEQLFTLTHSEHGDARNRAVRILDRAGSAIAELWDGPGRGLKAVRRSPVAGDQRVLIGHERDGLWRPLIYDARTKTESRIDVDLPGEIEPAWYPDAGALLLRHEYAGRGELYRYDLGRRAMERLDTPKGAIDWANVRPDGAVWFSLSTS